MIEGDRAIGLPGCPLPTIRWWWWVGVGGRVGVVHMINSIIMITI
jgi:hypothetical protein